MPWEQPVLKALLESIHSSNFSYSLAGNSLLLFVCRCIFSFMHICYFVCFRSCERVLDILRNSTDILLPILSVLVWDPLATWTLTTTKANRLQPDVTPVPMVESMSRYIIC